MIDQITQWQVFAKRPHVMVDIEALGVLGKKPIITQIGAVRFDIDTGETSDEFKLDISVEDSKDRQLTEDPDTVDWWSRQSPGARAHLTDPDALDPLMAALVFNRYMAQFKNPILWGNGNTYDNVMLREWMGCMRQTPSWGFRNDLDLRTLSNLCYATGFGKMPIPFEGTKHDGLDDAKHQVKWAVPMFQHLRGLTGQ